jgi:sec-independent protein translocase protein TatB
VFNIQGSELIFLLLVALIVLGPEKLPDAIRKAGRAYAEFKKMANGFQGELRQALDEPMRELRDTADAMRAAANFDLDGDGATPAPPSTTGPPSKPVPAAPAAPVRREQGLNFGSANPRRAERAAEAAVGGDGAAPAAAGQPDRPQGLNFGSANPRRQERTARDPFGPEAAVPPAATDAPSATAAPSTPDIPSTTDASDVTVDEDPAE